jgi:type I restriction enzyme S subunit
MDSVRNRFYFENLDVIEIPIPNIETQKKVVEIYKAFVERKEINEQLKALVKNLCPVLIKGSIEEAGEGLYA